VVVLHTRSCGRLTYSDNECAKQLLYDLDYFVWSMKITILDESADFTTLDTKKLFSKLKSHELSGRVVRIMILLLLVRLLLLVLILVVVLLTPPTLLTHLLWSLSCPFWS
jgi:hypothetical protein